MDDLTQGVVQTHVGPLRADLARVGHLEHDFWADNLTKFDTQILWVVAGQQTGQQGDGDSGGRCPDLLSPVNASHVDSVVQQWIESLAAQAKEIEYLVCDRGAQQLAQDYSHGE